MAQQPSDKNKQASKNASRPVGQLAKRTAPSKASKRSSSTLLTWGAIGLVLVIVVVLLVVKFAGGGSTTTSGTGSSVAPQSLVDQVTKIPASVYDTVGVTSPATPVSKPVEVKGQPALTFPDASGAAKPGVLYIGAEYCPYCAAERWPMIAALSRFGSFANLSVTQSSATDVYPNTPTFSFFKASATSSYLVFKGVEQYSNVADASGGYKVLEQLTPAQVKLISKYDTAKYLPGASPGSIPFISIGNRFLVAGASYSPAILSGLTRSEIAAGLSDPTNPATQAIVSTANYLTASICQITNQQPGSVCTSKGVQAANKSMGLSS